MPAAMLLLVVAIATGTADAFELPEADGYRGIWYMNQPTKDEYRYKYSGGFATYPQQHAPIAIHAPEARKTFFVYGGVSEDGRSLLHMVSHLDHDTGLVPRPRILLDKETSDAHDNPVLSIDAGGHLWIFSNSHGTGRPSFIHRSTRPHDISSFERVSETNFSYGQPWHLRDDGFLFLHTRYEQGRRVLHWMTSRDGRDWSAPAVLAGAEQGHYMVSWPKPDGRGVGLVFNVHPTPGGLNARTNLYYMETPDAGRCWRSAAGERLETPVRSLESHALVRDYRSEGLLVYLKDLQYDADGRPIVLYLTSRGYEPGPANGPRTWTTARWSGEEWVLRDVTTSDHNYDFGSLYVLGPDRWRIIAPTDPGPQPHATGGDLVVWETDDAGDSWRRVRSLTRDSRWNHTYVRRPLNAHPGFAALWADGDPLAPSPSRLYFADLGGENVFRLPERMGEPTAAPERLP